MLVNDTEGEEVYFMENAYVKPVAQVSQMEAVQPEACIAILLILAIAIVWVL